VLKFVDPPLLAAIPNATNTTRQKPLEILLDQYAQVNRSNRYVMSLLFQHGGNLGVRHPFFNIVMHEEVGCQQFVVVGFFFHNQPIIGYFLFPFR